MRRRNEVRIYWYVFDGRTKRGSVASQDDDEEEEEIEGEEEEEKMWMKSKEVQIAKIN